MTKTPTQEEIDNNPALAALQAMKYEDEDPVGKHEVFIKWWCTWKNPVRLNGEKWVHFSCNLSAKL